MTGQKVDKLLPSLKLRKVTDSSRFKVLKIADFQTIGTGTEDLPVLTEE